MSIGRVPVSGRRLHREEACLRLRARLLWRWRWARMRWPIATWVSSLTWTKSLKSFEILRLEKKNQLPGKFCRVSVWPVPLLSFEQRVHRRASAMWWCTRLSDERGWNRVPHRWLVSSFFFVCALIILVYCIFIRIGNLDKRILQICRIWLLLVILFMWIFKTYFSTNYCKIFLKDIRSYFLYCKFFFFN
jgi:hypothetical protein